MTELPFSRSTRLASDHSTSFKTTDSSPEAANQPNESCIGFFDSGQGGLTVWEAVRQHFPKLNTVYLGDNARYPYGNKSAETVTRYSSEAAFFFTQQNAKLMIVACGTASSVAVKKISNIFKIPIVGIVEGTCVAVLGTRYTVASGAFFTALTNAGVGEIWQMACPLFVPLVEEGVIEGEIALSVCEHYLQTMPSHVGIVMLACTHYPRLSGCIARYLNTKFHRTIVLHKIEGPQVLFEGKNSLPPIHLLDSSVGVYRAVNGFLESQSDRAAYFTNSTKLFCTDAPHRFNEVASLFSSTPLPTFHQVNVGV